METSVEIESIGFGGSGVGRLPDGRVCFVPFTLPGERVLIGVVREKKSFVEGRLIRILEASTSRVAPRCAVFGRCGGCGYQHAGYEAQLTIKTGQVAELLRRIGGFDSPPVHRMLPSPIQWGYRNRIAVHVKNGAVGFCGRKSSEVIPTPACPIASDEVNRQLAALSMAPGRRDGRLTLREESGFHGFSQVNPAAAEILAEVVAGFAAPGGTHLVDAYCGAGFFAKRLLRQFEKISGIEWSAGAIRAARASASPGESYFEGAVEAHLPEVLAACNSGDTLLLLDPPSEGLSSEVVDQILARPPGRIVYVSCDPPTLSRDLKKLSARFRLEEVQPVDMFPQTAEIEAVARLTHL